MTMTQIPQDKFQGWLDTLYQHHPVPELLNIFKHLEVIMSLYPNQQYQAMVFGDTLSPDAVIVVNQKVSKQTLDLGEYKIPLFQYSVLQFFPELIYLKTGELNNYLAAIQQLVKPSDVVCAYNVFLDRPFDATLSHTSWAGYRSMKLESKDHPILKLKPSFDAYIEEKKKNSLFKHQLKNNLRNIKKITRELNAVPEIERITRPDQVEHFLEQAEKIARKSYKWNLLNLTILNEEATRKSFKRLAELGLLRCYLLKVGSEIIAYNQSYQIDDTILEVARSYDPKYSQCSAGHVLTHLFIKDLHEVDPVKILNSGDGNGFHKEIYATEIATNSRVFLTRYNLKGVSIRVCTSLNNSLRFFIDLLAKLGVKEKIKTRFRRLFQQSEATAG